MSYFPFIMSNMRWLAGGFLLSMFSSFGQTFYIALSTGPIRREFDLSSGEYGSIYMIATLASALVLPLLGQLVDRVSVARIVVITTTMLGVACLILARSQSIWLLVVALFGLRLFGQGMMTHISVTTMGRWYAKNRGKAVAISALGFNAGLAVFPVGFVLVAGLIGWRQSWLVAAIIMVVVALPVIALLMRVERQPLGTIADSEKNSRRNWTRAEMLRDPLFWLTSIGILAPPFISTAIFFHQDTLLLLKGWSLDLFAWSFVWMTVISVLSSLVSGIIVDRTSATALLPVLILPMGLGCFVLAFVDASIAIFGFMALLGISMGVVAAIFGSIWPEVYGTRHLGSIRSFVMAMMVLFSALGPGVIGWLLDFGISLSTQLVWMGGYCFLATSIMYYCSQQFARRRVDDVGAEINQS